MELPLASRLREGELPAICAALESCGFDDPDTLADPFAAEELSVRCLKDALLLFLGGRAPPQSRRSRGAKARAPGLAIQLRRALSDHFRWPQATAAEATTTAAAGAAAASNSEDELRRSVGDLSGDLSECDSKLKRKWRRCADILSGGVTAAAEEEEEEGAESQLGEEEEAAADVFYDPDGE